MKRKYCSPARFSQIGAVLLAVSGIFTACSNRVPEEITAAELREHVDFLASDNLAGRFTGTAGIEEAEQYIAEAFGRMGLSPLPGEDDFFLEFDLLAAAYDRDRTGLGINGKTYTSGEDFRPFPFSSEGSVEAEVVFAGYGITAPEYKYDDYAGLDVEGKIVLIMRHEPDETGSAGEFAGKRHTRHAYFRTKAENAAAHGAAGMLLYTDPLHHTEDDDLRIRPVYRFVSVEQNAPKSTVSHAAEGFVAFHISRDTAHAILPGIDLSKLQAAVDSGQPASEAIGERVGRITARISQYTDTEGELVSARNVAAFLQGQNSELDEWIVVAAHHDHIGSYSGTGDTIYNGADDNASGVAGVIELAEQLASATAADGLRPGRRLDRSIAFITFSAEEIGLYGSYALDEYDLIDFDNVGFMLNLDMIGRNPGEPVAVYGDGLADKLSDYVLEANKNHNVNIELQGEIYEPFSDIAVFYENRVPFLMFYTGVHEDYHGTGDHAEKLDYSRMAKLVGLSYDIVSLAAEDDRLPIFKGTNE